MCATCVFWRVGLRLRLVHFLWQFWLLRLHRSLFALHIDYKGRVDVERNVSLRDLHVVKLSFFSDVCRSASMLGMFLPITISNGEQTPRSGSFTFLRKLRTKQLERTN